MDLGIKGRQAIVCGSSKGLGKACALALVKEGVNVVVSARTEAGYGNATKLLQKTLDGLGGGGGHEHRAGGKIPHVGEGSKTAGQTARELSRRWFDACGLDGTASAYLIARHEIVENLQQRPGSTADSIRATCRE